MKERRGGQLYPEPPAHLGQQPNRPERVASEVEEVVLHAYRPDIQQPLTHCYELKLEGIALGRRAVGKVLL